METALDSSVGIVAYLALFAGVGFVFVFVNLLLGRFLRPDNPSPEKQEIYECGEPAIGSSFVQFDLRFYVVALVFIIFDVEVAFLFPWATAFGKVSNLYQDEAANLARFTSDTEVSLMVDQDPETGALALTPNTEAIYREMGVWDPAVPVADDNAQATQLLLTGITDSDGKLARFDDGTIQLVGLQQIVIMTAVVASVFFVVLLVGFAYEWRTGALDWVRALENSPGGALERRASGRASPQESVLTA